MKNIALLSLILALPLTTSAFEKFDRCAVHTCRSYVRGAFSKTKVLRFTILGEYNKGWATWGGGTVYISENDEATGRREFLKQYADSCKEAPKKMAPIQWEQFGWKTACVPAAM